MTTQRPEEVRSGPAGATEPVAIDVTDFTRRVEVLRTRVAGSPHEAADDLLDAVGALDVAQEELRVADEELRAQRDQIAELLHEHESELAWRDRLSTVFPLAVLHTRSDGTVLQANLSALQLLGMREDFLVGKPLVTLVAPEHHSRFRDALTQANRSGEDQRVYVLLRPRRGEPVHVTAVASPDRSHDGHQAIRWAMLAESHDQHGGSTDDVATAAALAEMCTVPVGCSDKQAMASRLAVLAQQAIPRASAVSITLGSPEAPELLASDRVLAQHIDGVQQRAGQGPCIDAFHSRTVVVTQDVRDDHRWPRLSAEVHELDVAGVTAVPISQDEECLGVLNVYARVPLAFDEAQVDISRLVARSVSAVLHTARDRDNLADLAENLEQALSSRAVIDQAKGIIMARYGGTADDAFRRLSVLSQRSNIKVRDVARMLVENVGQQDPAVSPPARP